MVALFLATRFPSQCARQARKYEGRALLLALLAASSVAGSARAQGRLNVRTLANGWVEVSSPGKSMKCAGPADVLRTRKIRVAGGAMGVEVDASVQDEWTRVRAANPTKDGFDGLRMLHCLAYLEGRSTLGNAKSRMERVDQMQECSTARLSGFVLPECRELESGPARVAISITAFSAGDFVVAGETLEARVEVYNAGNVAAARCLVNVSLLFKSSGKDQVMGNNSREFSIAPNERKELRFPFPLPGTATGTSPVRGSLRCAGAPEIKAQSSVSIIRRG
jgi:hypothetical protein